MQPRQKNKRSSKESIQLNWVSFLKAKPEFGREVIIYDPAYSEKVFLIVWEDDKEADWTNCFWVYFKEPI